MPSCQLAADLSDSVLAANIEPYYPHYSCRAIHVRGSHLRSSRNGKVGKSWCRSSIVTAIPRLSSKSRQEVSATGLRGFNHHGSENSAANAATNTNTLPCCREYTTSQSGTRRPLMGLDMMRLSIVIVSRFTRYHRLSKSCLFDTCGLRRKCARSSEGHFRATFSAGPRSGRC